MEIKKLDYETWEEIYKPIINPFLTLKEQKADNGTQFHFHYSTIEENEFLKDNIGSGKLWTVAEGDRDSIYLMSGFHRVNRIYHFVTEIPFNISEEEIIICINEGYPQIENQDLKNLNLIIEKYKSEFGEDDIKASLDKISDFIYKVGLNS